MFFTAKKSKFLNKNAPIWADLARWFYFAYPLAFLCFLALFMACLANHIFDNHHGVSNSVNEIKDAESAFCGESIATIEDLTRAFQINNFVMPTSSQLHVEAVHMSGMFETAEGRHLFAAQLKPNKSIMVDLYGDYASASYEILNGLPMRITGAAEDSPYMLYLDRLAAALVDYEKPLLWLSSVGERESGLIVEAVSENGVSKLKVRKPSTSETELREFALYVCADTYRPLYATVTNLSHLTESELPDAVYEYHSFKAVNGIIVPHLIQLRLGSGTSCGIHISRMKFENEEIDSLSTSLAQVLPARN